MASAELSVEAQQALAATRLGDLKKKVNAAGWSDNMEDLLANWGEKSAGLRFMHNKAGSYWKGVSNRLTLWSIFITTVASTVSLVATNIEDDDTKNGVLFAVGGIGMVSSLIQSLKKFYNAEEKNADHSAIAKQFGSFYRYIVLQMGMSREDRVPADELSSWALKEFERLQQDSPPLGGDAINAFKKTFTNPSQAIPDVCEDEFVIQIFGRENEVVSAPHSGVNVVSSTGEVTLEVTSE
tara:strand:+ start:717 stop:1433 length:717 start_codon:yes stop_codon:yes gene_type:complete